MQYPTIHEVLTQREQEVLGCIASGESNKTAALLLGISENTLEQHLRNIYHKLKVKNRTEASLRYWGQGPKS